MSSTTSDLTSNGSRSPVDQDADFHFAVSRKRSQSPKGRGGGCAAHPRPRSPTSRSACSVSMRGSLFQLTKEKKAKKVKFYRNGDPYFRGLVFAISPDKYRSFEALLADLTRSLSDNMNLPHGARFLFSMNGFRITSLDELLEGDSYVCASENSFKKVDYERLHQHIPSWRAGSPADMKSLSKSKESLIDENRDYIVPRLITVIRHGTKPRKAVRVLLNKKTAHSLEQVLTDITNAIKLDTGAVRKVYTLAGKKVSRLQDFFGDDDMFIAYGHEKVSADDFDIDVNDVNFHSSTSRPSTPRASPMVRRKKLDSTNSNSPRSSPRPVRKMSAGSAKLLAMKNADNNDDHQERTAATNGNGDAETPAGEGVGLLDKYDIGKTIGDGNFAIVKEIIEKSTGIPYALKIIDKQKCKGREYMIENEVGILRRVHHPNVVLLVDEFDSQEKLFLVMELVTGGDLFDAIASATKYTEKDASGMLRDLASALKYLHKLSIVHRDVKPENLLVCSQEGRRGRGSRNTLKLGDFGLATEVHAPLMTVCGTPTYVAPEILAETGYGVKVDVWAAGVITYILLCGFPPFASHENNQEELFDAILAGHFEFTAPFWDGISNSAKDLILHMLRREPELRSSAEEVLEHPWICSAEADYPDDTRDLRMEVAPRLFSEMVPKSPNKTSKGAAGVMAKTPLDKKSRYFTGRRSAPIGAPSQGQDDDMTEIKCSFCRRRASNSSFGSQDGHHHHHHHSYPIDDDNELPVFESQPDDDQVHNGHDQESVTRGSAPEADEIF